MKKLLMLFLSVIGFQLSACGQKDIQRMDVTEFQNFIRRDSVHRTLAIGAKQLVVQDALETIV